jgi:hypothetical protein
LVPVLLAGSAVALASSAIRAAPPSVWAKSGPATVLIDAPVANGAVKLGLADVLTLTVRVDGPKSLEVKTPEPFTKSAGWRLLEAAPATALLDKDGWHWRRDYVFEPLAPGELSLQIEPLLVGADSGAWQKLSWRPMPVHVQTNITAAEPGALRDPTVIESLPDAPEAEPLPWGWLGGGAFFALLAGYCWRRWRRFRPSPITAEARASRALDRLQALRLPEQGKIERFHTLLANIVRRYLDRKLGLSSRRRTTGEFLETLRASEKLAPEQQDFLRDFFRRCDLAKFAGAAVTVSACAALAAQARHIVEANSPQPVGACLGQTAAAK